MLGCSSVSSQSSRPSPHLSCIMNARWMSWPRVASSRSVDAKFRRAPGWRIENRIFISDLVDRSRFDAIEKPDAAGGRDGNRNHVRDDGDGGDFERRADGAVAKELDRALHRIQRNQCPRPRVFDVRE